MDEWLNDRMNEWMSESLTSFIRQLFNQKSSTPVIEIRVIGLSEPNQYKSTFAERVGPSKTISV